MTSDVHGRQRVISPAFERRLSRFYDILKFGIGGAATGFAVASTAEKMFHVDVSDPLLMIFGAAALIFASLAAKRK